MKALRGQGEGGAASLLVLQGNSPHFAFPLPCGKGSFLPRCRQCLRCPAVVQQPHQCIPPNSLHPTWRDLLGPLQVDPKLFI